MTASSLKTGKTMVILGHSASGATGGRFRRKTVRSINNSGWPRHVYSANATTAPSTPRQREVIERSDSAALLERLRQTTSSFSIHAVHEATAVPLTLGDRCLRLRGIESAGDACAQQFRQVTRHA